MLRKQTDRENAFLARLVCVQEQPGGQAEAGDGALTASRWRPVGGVFSKGSGSMPAGETSRFSGSLQGLQVVTLTKPLHPVLLRGCPAKAFAERLLASAGTSHVRPAQEPQGKEERKPPEAAVKTSALRSR